MNKKLNDLQIAFKIAKECDQVPVVPSVQTLEILKKYIVPNLTKREIKQICKTYAGKSSSSIMNEITEIKSTDPEIRNRIEDIHAAKRIASRFSGFCLNFKKVKKEAPELVESFIQQGFTQKRLKALCDEFQGNKGYEIAGYLERI